MRPRRAQKKIKSPIATKTRVPPTDAPAIMATEGDLLVLLLLEAGGEVGKPVRAGAGVNTRVLDTTTSVGEKTPDETSMDEIIVVYSTIVEGGAGGTELAMPAGCVIGGAVVGSGLGVVG